MLYIRPQSNHLPKVATIHLAVSEEIRPQNMASRINITSACPYVRGHTCKKKKKKNFQTGCQKQQPHRPFLRSRVSVRAWAYVPVHAWPYVQKKEKKKKNCHVNGDVIAPCPVNGLVNKWP